MTLTTTPPPAASDDLELLWEYGRSRSTMAFQTVADRYIDLIYSAALRQVRDPHVADDVTQAVLIVMMNKAATLPPRTVLAAWLLTVTRYACLDVLKMEARRRRHEQAAAQERSTVHESQQPGQSSARWDELAPVVDKAILKLKTEDRDAVVLRFLLNKSPEEIAWVLGVSEEAARQRVSRALKRLRDIFARDGVKTMEEALGAVLLTNAVRPAPAATVAIARGIGAAGSGALSAPPAVIARATAHAMGRGVRFAIVTGTAAGVVIAGVIVGAIVYLHRPAPKPAKTPGEIAAVAPNAPPSIPQSPPPQAPLPTLAAPASDYLHVPRTETRLIVAATRRDITAVNEFIAAGDEVNVISRDGNDAPALVYATRVPQDQDYDIVKALLDAGANVNGRNAGGYTALMWAVRQDSPRTVQLLLSRGADVMIANTRGESALDFAKQSTDLQVRRSIEQAVERRMAATTTGSAR
jgi:RNA polymerase sigma factor (sigma-70 family)